MVWLHWNKMGRKVPAYTTDTAVLKFPCTGRYFPSPWGKFTTIPENFLAVFLVPRQEISHHAVIFPVVFQSPLYKPGKLPPLLVEGIPAYQWKKLLWVSVKILSVICKGIFLQRTELFSLFYSVTIYSSIFQTEFHSFVILVLPSNKWSLIEDLSGENFKHVG